MWCYFSRITKFSFDLFSLLSSLYSFFFINSRC
ncbi:hypothetical protein MG5_06251 [Candida albicans P57072]|nr:hypothetical protein MEO_06232 [Candida albicans P94015]KGQ99769.1 hypothetical protein MG5_06251 [Candida albicans P57072]KHC27442.1 hypothetical protein MGO_06221 [Candida albicans P76055]KHC27629.1 hypothetical protein MGQ_06238 [Candida albicans P76067]